MSVTTASPVKPVRRLRLAAFAAPAAAAIRWWLGELAGMVPVRLRRIVRRPGRWVVLDFSEGELVAGSLDGGNGARRVHREIERIALHDDGGTAPAPLANRPAVSAARGA